MPTLRNINPLGRVDVPLVRRSLEPGEIFDVDDDVAAHLLEQVGNYALVDDDDDNEGDDQ